MSMLDFSTLLDETPPWAEACFYCHPDELGAYDEARHLANHQPMTCDCCGTTAPNSLQYSMSHGANSLMHHVYSIDFPLCLSAWLRLNHLRHDILSGREPIAHDLAVLKQLHLLMTPEGDVVPDLPISDNEGEQC